MKRGKRYQEAIKLVEQSKEYDIKEALEVVEKLPKTKLGKVDFKQLQVDNGEDDDE